MGRYFDKIEKSIRDIDAAMKEGQFTRTELEGIILICKSIIGSTERALSRSNKTQSGKGVSPR